MPRLRLPLLLALPLLLGAAPTSRQSSDAVGLPDARAEAPAPFELTFRVLAPDGSPAAGARAALVRLDTAALDARAGATPEARADARGDVALPVSASGLYAVRVEAEGGVAAETAPLPLAVAASDSGNDAWARLPTLRLPTGRGDGPPTASLSPPWRSSRAGAWTAKPIERPPPRSPRKLPVVVVDSRDGRPLAEALLWRVGYPGRAWTTNEQGRVLLRPDPRIELHLAAIAPDHRMEIAHVVAATEKVRLALPPGLTLTGRVLDDEARPVSDAVVRLEGRGQAGDWRAVTASDADGRYRVCCLPPEGGGTLVAQHDGRTVSHPLPVPSEPFTERERRIDLILARTR